LGSFRTWFSAKHFNQRENKLVKELKKYGKSVVKPELKKLQG
jgi:hypothetical protein